MEFITVRSPLRHELDLPTVAQLRTVIGDLGSEISPAYDQETVLFQGPSTTNRERIDDDDAFERVVTDEWAQIWVTSSEPTIEFKIGHGTGAKGDSLSITVQGNHWETGGSDPGPVTTTVIDHIVELHSLLSPRHTFSLTWWDKYGMFDFSTSRFDPENGKLEFKLVDMIGWLTVFAKEGIERHGRDELLTAPVWRAEELPDGDVLIVLTDDPTDHETHAERYLAVLSHLGLNHLPYSTEIVYST